MIKTMNIPSLSMALLTHFSPRQILLCFLSLQISLNVIEFYINAIINYILSFFFGLDSFTEHNYFICPCCNVYQFLLLNSIPLYKYTSLFFHPFMDIWVVFFQLLTITSRLLWTFMNKSLYKCLGKEAGHKEYIIYVFIYIEYNMRQN